MRRPLVWLTDLDVPDRHALGLTSVMLSCDRTTYRCRVELQAGVEHWPTYARRHGIPQPLRDVLEADSLPMHWYVADVPLSYADITTSLRTSIFDASVPL